MNRASRIAIVCPYCGRNQEIPAVSGRLRCPSCENAFYWDNSAKTASLAPGSDDAGETPVRRKKTTGRTAKAGDWRLAWIVVAGAAACALALAFVFLSRPKLAPESSAPGAVIEEVGRDLKSLAE